ncbi:hypothetical protein JOE38_002346 [Clavibacter michiganensis]|uniref:hypothetical protein n=1 Tax=Clavibacter michiganensis TaxID=28447 RepID=UPI001956CA7C|nr:hypothetical protein [Clavibacter michiganensis]MBM7412523.1 hypothetical protein [Clavibacter michiganensis]
MTSNRAAKLAGGAAAAALSVHVIATILQNTPDSFNLDLRRYVGGWTIPGWRFFAPNPGIHNVHLLVRTSDDIAGGDVQTTWRDVTPSVPHGWSNLIINPQSRGPKALFDAMQQLTVMGANFTTLEWIRISLPYILVSDATRGILHSSGFTAFQFLLMNYQPSAPDGKRMLPVLISEWMPIASEERSRES